MGDTSVQVRNCPGVECSESGVVYQLCVGWMCMSLDFVVHGMSAVVCKCFDHDFVVESVSVVCVVGKSWAFVGFDRLAASA